MAAVQTDPIGQFNPIQYPFITDETRNMLAREKVRLMRDESAGIPAADIHRTEKFIFRSKPGTNRMIYHDFDTPPLKGIKNFDHYRFQWEKRKIEEAGLGPDSSEKDQAAAVAMAEKRIKDLTWRNAGNTKITFHRVRRHNECYFPTNDEVLAAYVRDLMTRRVGDFANVYEVSGKSRVIVGDKAFPDTELGWQTARTYARDNNIDDIKLVSE